MRRLGVVAGMVVVVALLVWAGVHNLRQRRLAMQQAQQSQITMVKDNGASTGDGMVENSLRGKAAPAFTLLDLSGKKVSLSDFKGHPVVINFWATYCGPCKLEMPWFQELLGKYQPQGLVILGVDQDEDMGKDEIASAAKKVNVDYPILLPDKKIDKTYKLGDYLPETFYVDKNGNVVEENLGAHSKDEIEADIRKTIAAGAM
jgi:thiol-disulfide isomerase/thioredoxin